MFDDIIIDKEEKEEDKKSKQTEIFDDDENIFEHWMHQPCDNEEKT